MQSNNYEIEKNKNDKIDLKQMRKYTMDTVRIIKNFLEDDEKDIIKIDISVYTAPEDAIKETWIILTNILNKNFRENEKLTEVFNKRAIEYNNLYIKWKNIN